MLLLGDTLEVRGPAMEILVLDELLAGLGLVRHGSPEHEQYESKERAEMEERRRIRDETERMASDWLEEHDVPDYVVDYLREDYF